jgi:hypothetical protein
MANAAPRVDRIATEHNDLNTPDSLSLAGGLVRISARPEVVLSSVKPTGGGHKDQPWR